VNHAFANPSGDRYAPDAAKDAWEKTLIFFEANLKSSEYGNSSIWIDSNLNQILIRPN